jgi:hypothetical protein
LDSSGENVAWDEWVKRDFKMLTYNQCVMPFYDIVTDSGIVALLGRQLATTELDQSVNQESTLKSIKNIGA